MHWVTMKMYKNKQKMGIIHLKRFFIKCDPVEEYN